MRIQWRGHQIIIPGDTETECWEEVTNDKIKGTTLLLAPHHGNNSGYCLEKVKAMNLAFVVISAGPKTEYDADRKYANQIRKKVYTTRKGKIIARIDENNTLHMSS